MKVRIIKSKDGYHKGEVVELSPEVATELIQKGIAKADKMMTDYNHGTK